MVLILVDDYVFKLRLGCEKGTNTRGDVVTLVSNKLVTNIHIVGDSKIIIDWMLKKCELHVENLETWKFNIAKFVS